MLCSFGCEFINCIKSDDLFAVTLGKYLLSLSGYFTRLLTGCWCWYYGLSDIMDCQLCWWYYGRRCSVKTRQFPKQHSVHHLLPSKCQDSESLCTYVALVKIHVFHMPLAVDVLIHMMLRNTDPRTQENVVFLIFYWRLALDHTEIRRWMGALLYRMI